MGSRRPRGLSGRKPLPPHVTARPEDPIDVKAAGSSYFK
eukprot:CAMPEP_0203911250 /NCGR_PEP_ID=MMETSP0359-20131031/52438_1 /ASSEMBLY_ACC=CAM_ASM_000338 /TAXON_ID=268821 /ORGANISM="Scrippsiella Hangoei, Strain SHTV-5" /LENGTH=38 /DNA_ID= /DNA_START= /DNA_END= /DNA_ORIENTATION=